MRLGGIESLMGSNQSIVFEGKMSRSQVENPSSIRRAVDTEFIEVHRPQCLSSSKR